MRPVFRSGEPFHDVAQVCLNGHLINGSSQRRPQHNQKHCARCGQRVIDSCPGCSSPIRGDYDTGSGYRKNLDKPPDYCHECGKPFPWTLNGIEAAKALAAELEGLTESEHEDVKTSIDELVMDTPRTQLAAHSFKKLMAKAKGGARELLLDLMAKIVVESVKSNMGL